METLIQPWPVQAMVRMRIMVATVLTTIEVVKESLPDSPRESSTSRLQLSKVVTSFLTKSILNFFPAKILCPLLFSLIALLRPSTSSARTWLPMENSSVSDIEDHEIPHWITGVVSCQGNLHASRQTLRPFLFTYTKDSL
jgi:hypothetical protein